MKRDPENDKVVLGMDILAPEGYGEIVGGGQRIHDFKLLDKRLDEHSLSKDAFQWYLDLRRFGSVPHSGFGMGIERVLVNLKRQDVIIPSLGATKILVAYMGDYAKLEAIRLCASLRSENVITVMGPTGRNLRSQLRYASSIGASHAVIVGEDEIKKGVFTVRNLVKSEQREVPLSELFGMFS